MKNKGFTFVELLGVIVIVIFIVLLTIPIVTNNINTKKTEVDETTKALILNATKTYREDNALKYPEIEDSEYCVYLETLTDIGYLAAPIKDINNKDVTKKIGIKLTYDNENNKFKYEIVENSACANIEFEQAANRCIVSDDENCKTCVLLRYLADSHYLSAEIIDEKDKKKAIVKEAIGQFEYIDEEDCLNRIILIAAREYVEEHPTVYRMINGNTYCLPVSLLQSKFTKYLNDNYSDYFNRKSVRIEIKDGSSNYTVVDKEDCSEALACGIYTSIPSNLTPVKYDENQEEWIATSTDDPEWYDYTNQKWANAVVLKSGTIKNSGDVVKVNGEISDPDALLMLVYIPRYSYAIKKCDSNSCGYLGINASAITSSTLGGIDIKCVNKNITEFGNNGTPFYTGNTPTNWLTHPAFWWDQNKDGIRDSDEELAGIWVGKFKAGSATKLTCDNRSCGGADVIRALPNELGIDSATFLTYYYAGLSMNREGSIFNINAEEGHFHLQKNTEFAAVAYLSQSRYGKYGNPNYTFENKNIKSSTAYNDWTGQSSGSISFKYDILNLKNYTLGEPKSNVALTTSDSGWTVTDNKHNYIYESQESEYCSIFYSSVCCEKTKYNVCIKYKHVSNKDTEIKTNKTFTINKNSIGKITFKYGTNSSHYNMQYRLYYCKNCDSIKDSRDLLITGSEKSNTTSNEISLTLEPGKYKILFTYTRDGSDVACQNCKAYVEDLSVIQTTNYTAEVSSSTENGVRASTTGNIYGVYDFVGKNEVVAARNKTGFSADYVNENKLYMNFYGGSLRNACGTGIYCYGHAFSNEITQTVAGFFAPDSSVSNNSTNWIARKEGISSRGTPYITYEDGSYASSLYGFRISMVPFVE